MSWAWKALNGLPHAFVKVGFRCLASLHYHLDKKHVKETMSMVEWSGLQADPKSTIRNMYLNLWKIIPELLKANRFEWSDFRQQVQGIDEFSQYVQEQTEGRGIVFVTGHLGNWELCGWVLSKEISPMLSVYKPHKWEWINRFFKTVRNRSDQEIVAKEGAMLPLFKKVKRGGIVGLVIDQYGGHEGVDSEFLGRPCKSWDSSVLLADKTKAPLIPVVLIREAGKFRLCWSERIDLTLDEDNKVDIQASVRKLDDALGELVKAAPDQWMWLGRRWGRDFLTLGK